ncbi:MAG: (Fe-S)-binding protein, partial [Phycisphaerales bacterium]|nr:(Fe-S)-binding protein [Phycisphaerales bacterium]
MSTSTTALFLDALQARVDATIDACTQCGECVKACPMVEPAGLNPADAPSIAAATIDLLQGGTGTPESKRWADVCTNSGKCIPACTHGVNPRFMVNMARAASRKRRGSDIVRRDAHKFFADMNRSTRVISRLLLPPEVLDRFCPPLKADADYVGEPDIVFYTGCNIGKTPHIALLVLEVLDALNVKYEVMGGVSTCCGIQHFKQGDTATTGRFGFNTIERLSRPKAARVVSWCPSCQVQIGEIAIPAYEQAYGRAPFDLSPIAEFFAERVDDLRKLFIHPVHKRVALQERAAVPGINAAVKTVLRAIPGLEVVDLDVPVVSTQASHLSVLPKFKAELREREFEAARAAGVTAFASLFHGCHRELVKFQPDVP